MRQRFWNTCRILGRKCPEQKCSYQVSKKKRTSITLLRSSSNMAGKQNNRGRFLDLERSENGTLCYLSVEITKGGPSSDRIGLSTRHTHAFTTPVYKPE